MTELSRYLGRTAAGDGLIIDLDRLIGSHACIVANPGGGKSGLIRRLLEVTHGGVQHIVLDSEDEFYTLRRDFDYVIAGGDGGDVPVTVDSAAGLATAALTHGFSMIVQLNGLGRAGAAQFVDAFCEAMISAPEALWRPCLVVIDEAHRFAPATGGPSTSGVAKLTGEGRKRGFTAVIASQRITKLHPDVRGDCNNWMLGRVGQTLDRNAVADALGFSAKEGRERLIGMPERTFWGFGPAISREPVAFMTADTQTQIVKSGQAKVSTPPAPEALREILAGLAVAKVAAQPDAKTADICQPGYPDLRERMEAMEAAHCIEIATGQSQLNELMNIIGRAQRELAKAFENEENEFDVEASLADVSPEALRGYLDKSVGVAVREQEEKASPHSRSKGPLRPTARKGGPSATLQSGSSVHPVSLHGTPATPSPAANAIADLLDRINPARLTWAQAATMTGRKANGGNFNAARKWLRASGRIVEEGDLIRSANDDPAGLTREEALALWKSVLPNPAPKMIAAMEFWDEPHTKEHLGCDIGAQPRGGNFNSGFAHLRRNGLLYEYGSGSIKLAEPLPGEMT